MTKKQDGIWLGLIHIPQKEYEKRVADAKKSNSCWVCNEKLKLNGDCIHRFA